jgi:flagellar hook-basal body complex protein FliE
MAGDDPLMRIQPLEPRRTSLGSTQGLHPSSAASSASSTSAPGSFRDVLAQAVGEVQRLQTEADTTIKQLIAGEIKDVTQAMMAVEKADVAFQTLMGVRNKIVTAYEEIMRMQV